MKKLIIALTLTTAMSGMAMAADVAEYVEPAPERMNPFSANVAIWGQYVTPSSYDYEDGDTCNGFPDDFCDGAFGFGGDARAHYDFGNMHGAQLELLTDNHGELEDDDNSSDKDRHTSYTAVGGHWIYRPGNYALGAFGGVSHTAQMDEDERNYHGFIGGEAAWFMDNATLFGQVGYNKALGDYEDAVDDLVFGRIGARYFFAPNSRLEGSLAYGLTDDSEVDHDDAPGDNTEELDWFQVAANYEHKFDTNPFSVFVGYQGDYVDISDTSGPFDESAWVHTFKLGVRMSFGGTLRDDDRYGARTFDFTNLRAPLSYSDEL